MGELSAGESSAGELPVGESFGHELKYKLISLAANAPSVQVVMVRTPPITNARVCGEYFSFQKVTRCEYCGIYRPSCCALIFIPCIWEKIMNSGNYNYNYAHSLFGKDLKNVNIKVIRREKRRTCCLGSKTT